jgi:hypothetical protein
VCRTTFRRGRRCTTTSPSGVTTELFRWSTTCCAGKCGRGQAGLRTRPRPSWTPKRCARRITCLPPRPVWTPARSPLAGTAERAAAPALATRRRLPPVSSDSVAPVRPTPTNKRTRRPAHHLTLRQRLCIGTDRSVPFRPPESRVRPFPDRSRTAGNSPVATCIHRRRVRQADWASRWDAKNTSSPTANWGSSNVRTKGFEPLTF